MVGSQRVIDQAAGIITCAVCSAIGATAKPLVAQSQGSTCKRVRLIAPRADGPGAAANTVPVFFGNSVRQNDQIALDGSTDQYIHVDDASKIYVKASTASTLEYRIEQ